MAIRDLEKWRVSVSERIEAADTIPEALDAEEEWGLCMNELRLAQIRLETQLRLDTTTANA